MTAKTAIVSAARRMSFRRSSELEVIHDWMNLHSEFSTTERTEDYRGSSPFDIFGEHFFWIDSDEDAAAAGEHFSFFIEDLGGVDVGASALLDFAAFDAQRLLQRYGLEILDGHLPRERNYVVQLVYFAHGVVEDAGDDAAVAVAGGSGIALAEAELTNKGLAGFVEDEFEAHAFFIVLAADEAVVLLHFVVAGFVALGLAGHVGILRDSGGRV